MSEHPLGPSMYLSDSQIGLRAPVIGDAPFAHVWHEGPAPFGMDEVEQELRRQESIPWGGNPAIRLIAVELSSGRIAGGVVVTRSLNRTSRIQVTCPPSNPGRNGLLHGILGLVVPWLLDEVGLMTAVLETPADDEAMVSAAEAAGLAVAVRRREHVVRPHGRVDLFQLERVNRDWGRYAG